MRHFLFFTFVAISICFHSTADIKRFIETWRLSDLTFKEMRFISKFKLPKDSIVNAKEMKVCEQLCCANIVFNIRRGKFDLAREKLANFTSLLEATPKGFQTTYDWNWLKEILSDIDQILEILKQKRAVEEDINISRTRIPQTQAEGTTAKTPIKRSREATDFEEPTKKRIHISPSSAQRIYLELPAEIQLEDIPAEAPTMHQRESESIAVPPQIWLSFPPATDFGEPAKKRIRISPNSPQRIYLNLPAETQLEDMPAEAPTMHLRGSEGMAVLPQIWLSLPQSPEPEETTRERQGEVLDIPGTTDAEGCRNIHLTIPYSF